MEVLLTTNLVIAALLIIGGVLTIKLGVKVVPQSKVYVVERFGKYSRTLNAGLSLIIPFLDRIAHKVDVLERQLDEQRISVYRISNINEALKTASSSIVRSAAGKLELDDLQSSREAMNIEIETNLRNAAEVWGIEITRTEITDVVVDDATKEAQRQQLNAERKKRATIAEAEAQKRSIELRAEADLIQAEKNAEAIRVTADAEAYSIKMKAEADAEQTRLLATAIAKNGKPAVDFEIAKRQVEALSQVASAQNSKTIILPSDVTAAIGGLSAALEIIKEK
jgi:regulator of protease activity HflC (stomatin/prohibitin superfamily)